MENIAEFSQQYEIDYGQPLPAKGLGSVYRAKDQNEKIWALKVLELHPNFDNGLFGRLYERAKKLEHPNLLPYEAIHVFREEDVVQYYILMEYCSGGDWASRSQQLSEEEKRQLLQELLKLLIYLEKEGHCLQNLKLEHLLFKEEESLDWQLINYGAKESLPNYFHLDYAYLAPEQLQGQAMGSAVDIWAFGVLLTAFWTGQLPFGQKSPQQTNAKIKNRILKGELPRELLRRLPLDLRYLVEGCLQKEPAQRWASFEALAAAWELGPAEDYAQTWQAAPAAEVSVLETLAYMGQEAEEGPKEEEEQSEKTPFLQRKFKRKKSKPITIWEVLLWLGGALVLGYCISSWT